MREHLRARSREKVLDIGCGTGELVARLFISIGRGQKVSTPSRYQALAHSSFANVTGVVQHKSTPCRPIRTGS
jgi:ubiquinone/menaquinone biosynthesis C-methylase UbiE